MSNRHEVINTISQICDVHPFDLMGRDRRFRITRARQMAAYFLRQSGLSLPKAGAMLGGMHHTTVMNAIHRIETRPQEFEPHLSKAKAALL